MQRVFSFLLALTAIILIPNYAIASSFPDTGQINCYNLTGQMTCPFCPILTALPFCGQDAQYQPRLPRTYTRLGQKAGGEWIMTRDEITGLVWENKTTDYSIHNSNNTYTWREARDVFIRNLNDTKYGGHNDWRLPTVKELSSLVNAGVPWSDSPTIDSDEFPNTKNLYFWTDTEYRPRRTTHAWFVNFYNGIVHYDLKTKKMHVRAVRGNILQTQIADNGDGTVTDTATGLMWTKCNAGQTWNGTDCDNSPLPLKWENALTYPLSLEVAGFSDWRLPNRNELQSLVDYSQTNASIDSHLRNHTQNEYYWTSTSVVHDPSYAWRVNFSSGNVGLFYKDQSVHTDEFYVRAVRSGSQVSFGSLTVNIGPPAALSAGAQWRRTGTNQWLDSGFEETNVPAGNHRIEFKNITGWDSPANVPVLVNQGINTTISETYTPSLFLSNLTIHIFDDQGEPISESWRRTGTSKWYLSGELEKDVLPGVYTIEFSHIPETITVTVY